MTLVRKGKLRERSWELEGGKVIPTPARQNWGFLKLPSHSQKTGNWAAPKRGEWAPDLLLRLPNAGLCGHFSDPCEGKKGRVRIQMPCFRQSLLCVLSNVWRGFKDCFGCVLLQPPWSPSLMESPVPLVFPVNLSDSYHSLLIKCIKCINGVIKM